MVAPLEIRGEASYLAIWLHLGHSPRPQGTILQNSYDNPITLFISDERVLSFTDVGTTQGADPLVMAMHALAVTPLI